MVNNKLVEHCLKTLGPHQQFTLPVSQYVNVSLRLIPHSTLDI